MTGKAITAITLGVLGILLMCSGVIGALVGGSTAYACGLPASTPPTDASTSTDAPSRTAPTNAATTRPASVGSAPSAPPTLAGYTAEQLGNATVIVTVGRELNIPPRGWVIALASALQESGLRNLPGGDRDSVGLFQQRPSQGWGTAAQLHDPAYATTAFYQRLLTVPNWQSLPVTDAAQAVQRSAYPDAYAKWEPPATQLVTVITDGQVSVGICAGPAAVFARAQTWLTAWSGGPVPYLSSNAPADLFGGYRRDCSGYVSMALGLPGPGLNATGLAARSTLITKDDLQPGDLLINTSPDLAGHVVLFERWADPSKSSYMGYEQSGDGGTHYRQIPYPYYGTYVMSPHRLNPS